ncbi:O-antigen polymerase [Bacillus sp. AFS018417]|uniref:O-antigen polymerase n=1 Tax=Bacillus sp. AFS018417 TaxID=2033491 RepID=UPI0015970C96|nr:O-antigen polymerase [Bacillus sp. AFS018417]
MQIFTISFILLILFSLPIFYFRKRGADTFSPVMISMFLIIITNIPYLISISRNYDILNPLVRWRIPETEIDYAIAKYAVVLVIGVIGLLLGVNSRFSAKIVKPIPVFIGNESKVRYFWAFLFSLFLGLLGYKIFMNSAGGFSNFINNLEQRASYTNGSGYVMTLMSLLEISVYIFICTFKYKKTLFKYLVLMILIVGTSFLLSSMGGRKSTLQFIIFSMIVWHFAVGKIKRLSFKMCALVPVALFYIVVMPIIRTPDGVEVYTNNPEKLVTDVVESTDSLTQQFSYIDHYLFIMDYFTIDKLWLGSSFMDLLYAPLPSSIYPDKPPVDDGVYIRTLAEGWEVSPSTPFKEMYPSSWPPETFGAMYMNFWIPGVFIGFYILGMLYRASYLYMIKSEYSLYSILIYGNILLNFHISNLRIVQTLTDIILITVFLGLFFFGFKKKYRLVW